MVTCALYDLLIFNLLLIKIKKTTLYTQKKTVKIVKITKSV